MNMRKMLTAIGWGLALLTGAEAADVALNGAGASFPAPVYQSWTYIYSQATGTKVNYQSLGSGAGVNQIKSGTVDFAGTDNPLTAEELEKNGLQQFPMLIGGVVVIVNIPGVKNNTLKLSREALADIFLGKITRWDDAKLKALNPELKLPRLKITVVRRADASGTSFIFTDYLTKISTAWAETVGCGAAVKWPVGIGGQKNPGVCNNVAKIRGGIGYTEYTYAVEAKLPVAVLENKDGKYVEPTPDSFSAGAANADWRNAPGFHMMLTDQPGENSWPITGVTYILLRKDCESAKRRKLVSYFNWCFSAGGVAARKLNYVPLPENVAELINERIF